MHPDSKYRGSPETVPSSKLTEPVPTSANAALDRGRVFTRCQYLLCGLQIMLWSGEYAQKLCGKRY
jgi:hypothetical protein